ncbi:MAG TPA: hypothetical protein VGB53_03385 [Rubricoccaceae bacterium]
MTERLRLWIGWRAAHRLVARRIPAARPDQIRRVLVLLPSEPAALRAAWHVVDQLAVPVVPVVVGTALASVPDRFAGTVTRLGPDAHTWTGAPRLNVLEGLWRDVDVVVALVPLDTPAVFAAVAACPASLRVGVDGPDSEGALDLAVGASPRGRADVAERMLALLRAVRPPVVPLHAVSQHTS